MNDLDNSIKSYLILCRQKDLGAIHRIVDDLALNNSINNVAVNHNLSINSVEHTNRIFQLVGGDSMKVIADKIYAKYNAIAGKDPISQTLKALDQGAHQINKKVGQTNEVIKQTGEHAKNFDKGASDIADSVEHLGETAGKIKNSFGRIGKSVGSLIKPNEPTSGHPTTEPTIKSLQEENKKLRDQLNICNENLSKFTTPTKSH